LQVRFLSATSGFQVSKYDGSIRFPFGFSVPADTAIVPLPVKVLLAGIPLTPVPRVAGAIFHAATNPDPETNGCAWLLPDNGPVFRVKPDEFKQGVYKVIDDRANGAFK
jgi:hypothetical protein